MRRLLICGMFSLFSFITHAEIQARVEPSEGSMDETFRLTLTQQNSNGGVPNLTVLQKDFIIIGTERQVNYSIINGQSESNSEWVINLKAQKPGVLTIPSIALGQEHSAPITINIEAKAKNIPSSDTQNDILLVAQVNENKPYINQQIIYTVKLYNSKRLLDTDYQGPQVEDALVIPLGEAKQYKTIQNNINYVVEEQNYAIYPQKSGPLKIISPTFSALIYDMNPQRATVQDKTINLMVSPIPPQYKGALWLPAKKVKLTEHYEHSNQTLRLGSTLTRTISLEGVSIPAQLLPNIDFSNTDDFNVYPEKGVEHNQVKQGELVGSTDFKVTYLFNKVGKVTIPELKIHWFNIETGTDEIAILAPRSMDITPSVTASNTSTNKPVTQNVQKNPPSKLSTVPSPKLSLNYWPWIMALFFALAWIITLSLWWRPKRTSNLNKRQYKEALEQLNKACTACNPKQARDALLKWASLHWPDAQLLNLTDLSTLVREPHLKKQLLLLSQVIYKSDEQILWRGDELLKAVYALKKKREEKKQKIHVLPPINPF